MNFKNSLVMILGLVAAVYAAGGTEMRLNNKIYIEKPVVEEIPANLVVNGKDIVDAVPLGPASQLRPEIPEPIDSEKLTQPKAQVDKAAADLLEKKEPSSIQLIPIKAAEPVKPVEPEQPAAGVSSDASADVNSVNLPPIPLIMPSILSKFPPLPAFLQQLMDRQNAFMNDDIGLDSSEENSNDDKVENDSQEDENSQDVSFNPSSDKHGFMSIFLFKSNRNQDSDAAAAASSSNPEGSPIKTNLLIMKILPRPLIGGDTDPDHAKKVVHLLGGSSDPDHPANKLHLFGGDSDSAERFRFGSHGMLTGNEDAKINSYNVAEPTHPESLFERIKNMFRFGRPDGSPSIHDMQPPHFIIRTDDGSSAFISNDIGSGSDLPQPQLTPVADKKNCKMFGFMRLRDSPFYRNLIHVLFFTGIALFVLFAALLTLRSMRRRRAYRYHTQQNMNIASIDPAYPTKAKSNRLSWLTSDLSSTRTSDIKSSLLMPQPPPAYDQVLITTGDSESSSVVKQIASQQKAANNDVNSLALAYKNKYQNEKNVEEDEKSIISMPPEYDHHHHHNQDDQTKQ